MIPSATTRLIANYETALTAAVEIEPPSEKALYDAHVRALEELKRLVLAGAANEEIHVLLKAEERQFGWSYLSGDHGDNVEKAFRELLRDVEDHL